MGNGDKSAAGKKKHRFWIIFMGILIAVSLSNPDLWAAPGHSPTRQGTVPTATPTRRRATQRPSSTNPPPTTGAATSTPSSTGESIRPTQTPSGRATTSLTTIPATSTGRTTTTRTAVPAETIGSEDAAQTSAPTTPPTERSSPELGPTTTTPAEPADGAGGGALVVFGGVGLVIVGLVLLAAWRLRG